MLNGLRILFINELVWILREKIALFWIFFFPFFFLAIMLISYGSQGMFGHQRIEVVDNDMTPMSARYIEKVRSTFSAGTVLKGEIIVLGSDASAAIADGVVRVTVPRGFGNAFAESGHTTVKVAYNFAGGLATNVAARVFTVLTTTFNSEVAKVPSPAKLDFENTSHAKPVDYLQYLLTGIMVMSLMTAGMNNTCVALVARRERNTFKLMSCLPLTPWAYLASILLSRVVVLFIAAFVLLIGGRYAYDVSLPLSPWQLLNAAGLILIGGMTLLFMGIAMSARIAQVQTAVVLCNVVYLCLLFASDLTMPLNSYPDAIKPYLLALPTSQFAIGLRAILIQGSDLASQWRSVANLAAWAVGCLVISRVTFRWQLT